MFTVTVTNNSTEAATLTSLSDSDYGDLDGEGTCLTGGTIAAGATYTCSFSRTVSGDFSGDPHENTATATVSDDDGNTDTESGTATVSFSDVLPSISVTKSADDNLVPETGQSVTFTFTVTNLTGEPVDITSLTDSDFTLVGDGDCQVGTTLAGFGTCSFTQTEIISGDFSGPDHVDTFTATAEDNEDNVATASDSETIDFSDVLPSISVTKSADDNLVPETGQSVTFTFTVTNLTGEPVDITSLTDSDFTLVGDGDCQVGTTLAGFGTCSFTQTEIISGDFSGPDHVDTFTATAEDNEDNVATASDSETIDFSDVLPSISVTKSADDNLVPETGQSVTFTFTVTNLTGEPVDITSLTDSDFTLVGDGDCQVGTTLAGFGTCSFTQTEIISGDFSGPDHVDTFTATAEDNEDNVATASDSETIDFSDVLPSISVSKTPSVASVPETGAPVTFTVVVTNNTGESVTLDSLTDSDFGDLDGEGTCATGGSIVGFGSFTCSFTETVSGDFSGPAHSNTATATASDNDGNDDTESGTATVTFTDVPTDISVTKTANDNEVPETGQLVTFTFVVTNNTAEPVVLDSLVDSDFGDLDGQGTCVTGGTLAGNGTYTCAVSVVISGDFSGASHVNTVTATASDNEDNTDSPTDAETITFTDVPTDISVTKTANDNEVPETGQLVTFTFVVTNNTAEPVVLDSLVDSDFGDLDGQGTCVTGGTLAGNGTYTCAVSVVISGDFSGASHVNTVTATASDNEDNTDSPTDAETITFTDVPTDISVTKTANDNEVPETGQLVTFTFVVTNNTAEPVVLDSLVDSDFGDLDGQGTCVTGGTLAGNGTYTCAVSVVISGDFSGASHVNTVTATASDNEDNTDSPTDAETITFTDVPTDISVTKTANDNEVPETGQLVTFTFVVTNNTAEPVVLDSLVDSDFGDLDGQGTCVTGGTLAGNGTYTCAVSVVISGDFSGASHVNTVTATASDNEDNTDSPTDAETITFTDVPTDISVTKTANDNEVPETGQLVTFTFVVTNNTAEPVVLDSLVDSDFGDLDGQGTCVTGGTLAGNGTYTCAVSVVISGDFSGASHVNTVTATASDNEDNTDSPTDAETITFTDVLPSVDVDKSATPTSVAETGGSVTFTFTVTNTGLEAGTITSLTDTDFVLAGDGTCMVGTVLAGGASCDFTHTTTISGDFSGPAHQNTFTAVLADNDANTDDDSDLATVTFTDVLPSITVTKTPSPTSVPETGGPVTFTVVITNNTGEAVKVNSLSDSDFGNLNGQGTCVIGATIPGYDTYTCTFTATVTGNATGPAHQNTATATASDNDTNSTSASGTAIVTFTDVQPSISVTKTPSPTSVPETGGSVVFTLVVTNNTAEPVVLTTLTDSDYGNLDGQGSCDVPAPIAGNGSYTCSFTMFISGDFSGPSHQNTVSAAAADDETNIDTESGTAVVTFTDVLPSVTLDKSVSPASRPEPGGVFTYTLTITNTSLESATIASLTDSNTMSAACLALVGSTIGGGASATCTYTATFTNAGSYGNTAVVTVADNDGNSASSTDTATAVVTDAAPTIDVVKTAGTAADGGIHHINEQGGSSRFHGHDQ